MFEDKTLLITGGTGSFGHAVVHYFLSRNIKQIRIFSRDEKKQEDMRIAFSDDRLKFYIGDVRDEISLMHALSQVDYVFHAAALKQVPSCEFYPLEAVKTNILGTENVINAAIYHQVARVILLSTDKAVYPINAMGMSKAMAEKVLVARSRIKAQPTTLCATRYGNVVASRGSVVPLFIEQIKAGKPLTITDPNMTRFLMSLENSVDLVLHAFEHGQQGDIFVQKSPACTLLDLAHALKALFNSDVPINVIGTRHGEKLYESLISREEMARAEDMAQYYRIPADTRDLNYNKYFIEGEAQISVAEDYTSHNTKRLNIAEIKDLLLSIEHVRRELSIWQNAPSELV
ncbi:MAG TPA: UDP-glucose 4-epimerase [Legionellales bacterium]|nr:UDP-glucose 4-epimerase [Legionellales bacterium]HCA89406.1 UDP-glucose 4-epimerase [Legionellales bacterium]|tara:strand:+ start:3382 stop:4416 length:1035 start_codon:yes stop_codon:yes gene_type:complete